MNYILHNLLQRKWAKNITLHVIKRIMSGEEEMEGLTTESLFLLILPITFSGLILLACISIFCFTREQSEIEDNLALRGQTANHTDAIPALKGTNKTNGTGSRLASKGDVTL